MTPYYVTFTALALLSLTHFIKELKRYRLPFFLVVLAYLILFAGLRAPHVAADYSTYVNKFETVPHLGYWFTGEFVYTFAETWMEPAYIAYGAFVKVFTDEYIWMFLAVAFLSVGIASYNYYRYAPYLFLTLLLFYVHTYFYRDMTQIRAAVAAAIGLFLVAQILCKHHTKALVTIGMAGLFHMASLSLLIPWLASFVKLTRKKVFVGIIIALVLGSIGISHILLQVLPNLGYITVKLIGYSQSHYIDTVQIFDITNLKNLAIIAFVLLFWKRLEVKVPYFHILVLFMFLATAWRIAFADFGIFAARVATFFGIVEVLLVPAFILIFRQKIFISLIVIVYAFMTLYLNAEKKLNPYELGIELF